MSHMDEGGNDAVKMDKIKRINFVVLYQDTVTGSQAMQTYRRIVDMLGTEFDFDCHFWDFNALENSDISKGAAEQTALADIVIVAAHPASDLPASVKAWFDLWEPRNGEGKRALVRLIPLTGQTQFSGQSEDGVHDHLRRIATVQGMDFISPRSSAQGTGPDSCQAHLTNHAHHTGPILDAILCGPPNRSRWEIQT